MEDGQYYKICIEESSSLKNMFLKVESANIPDTDFYTTPQVGSKNNLFIRLTEQELKVQRIKCKCIVEKSD